MPKKKPAAANEYTTLLTDGRTVRVLPTTNRIETWELRWPDHENRGAIDTHRVRGTKLDAVHEAEEIRRRLDAGIAPHLGRKVRVAEKAAVPLTVKQTEFHTLETAEQEWAESFGKKPRSLAGARYNLQRYVYPAIEIHNAMGKPTGETICLREMALEDITDRTITTWLRSLQYAKSNRDKPFSASTRALALRNLNTVLNYAVKRKWIQENPAKGQKVDLYGVKTKDSFEDEAQFFRVLRHLPDWAKAPVIVLAYTGVRFGEGAGFIVSAIDMDRCRIYIDRQIQDGEITTVKTVGSEDWVPFHPSLKPIFEAHLSTLRNRGPFDLLFVGQTARGKSLQNPSLNRALRAACEAAGLDIRVTCHGLRRSLASWLHDRGVPVKTIQKILRHQDIRTTMSYIDVSEAKATEAMGRLTPIPEGVLT